MSRRSKRRGILPASLLLTVLSVALARTPAAEKVYRGRKALLRRVRFHRQGGAQAGAPVRSNAPGAASVEADARALEQGSSLAHMAHRAERQFDRVKDWVAQRYSGPDPLQIVLYRGYGTAEKAYLRGRVLEDEGIRPSSEEDSVWRNVVNVYKSFESDEVPGARVRAQFGGREYEATTDEEGYFELWMTPAAALPDDRLWHEVQLTLLEPAQEPPVHATGYVLVPPPRVRFGVISDVDDTIVMTNATSLLKMARTVFLGNAYTRVPFEGVAAFYEALQAGVSGAEFNPLFYVSSSPWNLYGMLAEFLQIQDIPIGPLMLRDWGISNDEVLPTKHAPHKRKAIKRILDTFPHLPFILIGDSGQEDPEIYAEIVHQNPDRILAIYIRNVSLGSTRPDAIASLADEVTKAGSTLILADDTLAAAQHAASQGWIDPAALPRIRTKVAVDKSVSGEEEAETLPTIVVEGGE